MNRRALMLLLTSLLLAVLLGQLNHYLGAWQFHVWCGGLYITLAALRLDFRTGATTAFLTGLMLDAGSPVIFGTHALLFLAAHAVIFNARARAPRDETLVGVIIALLANLGLFLALCFLRIGDTSNPGDAWMRNFADLALSQIVLALIAPWFFVVQIRTLKLGGVGLRQNPRSIF